MYAQHFKEACVCMRAYMCTCVRVDMCVVCTCGHVCCVCVWTCVLCVHCVTLNGGHLTNEEMVKATSLPWCQLRRMEVSVKTHGGVS